ncbi:MAG TPA: GGDEF domain-containing protein [Burkholderiales bacterium]
MHTTSQPAFVLDEPSFSEVVAKAAGNFILPLLIVCASFLLVSYAPDLPDFFVVLKIYAPYFMLGAGLMIALAFKRGRALFAVLSLLIAYICFRVFFAESQPAEFVSNTVYAVLCILVPLNLAILTWVRERGALNSYGWRRLAALLIAVGLTAAVIFGEYKGVTEFLHRPLLADVVISGSPIPQSGIVAMLVALVAAISGAVARGGVIEAALAVSIVAFAAACNVVATSDMFMWFTAAGLIVTVAVLQDSHRMAFSDELTGLPGRRALNESLMALNHNYTIAMLDVDHFKAFNDKWGHDIGDQVLKLVASRIQRVGGGGRAYRYGGEEFTIVFPGKRLLEVMSRLDALRKSINEYKLRIRSATRPRQPGEPGARPAADGMRDDEWISVTVSAGVAEKNDRLATPEEVIQSADQALYRAKESGRNRVSR